MSQFWVGLTGGIGSGKSTVAEEFVRLGVQQVDADIVARQVVAPGTEALDTIVQQFGDAVRSSDGQLDRARLRQIVFSDEAAKTWLNQLLHPLIRQEMLRQLSEATSPYVLLVAPLLLENKLDQLVDTVLVVDVSEQTQITRTSERDGSPIPLVQSIMAAQCSRQQRLARANYVISNEGSIEALQAKVAELHRNFLRSAEEKLAKSLT
ncbi:dephospho-CoA kinase [Rheinheimera sp. F8]|uniref:dephospho-CoA kinase n=1 Tax=Rheinheimera sp. F8 TaxID=1763998 RepID=UPI000744858F|nr:dephospho-CoA kinase [Rheinheimera sp. F8]ALZ75901.1 dephospho-CoA kinase [Rheinheimera sp. F8]